MAGKTLNKIEEARNYFLKALKAKPGATFIFTGSATESNNAVLNAHITRKDKKYIFSAGEHSSIYETAKYYKEQGYNIVFVPLLNNGAVDTIKLMQEIDDTVALVSIIYVSNETGAINNIKDITKQIKLINSKVIVHTDAVQAVGKVEINVKDLNIDYLTISAHKINGPKGIGGLYIANPNKFKPFILGGGQEKGLRAGTENLPQIEAFKVAFENVNIKDYSSYKQAIMQNIKMKDYICVSNDKCVDNIISLCFKGIRGETILHMLEEQGYLIGTGSACNSKAGHNRVLQRIVPNDYIEGAIRISFGDDVTVEDCANLGKALTNAVNTYRERIKR
jgi:cysteine desulfurase